MIISLQGANLIFNDNRLTKEKLVNFINKNEKLFNTVVDGNRVIYFNYDYFIGDFSSTDFEYIDTSTGLKIDYYDDGDTYALNPMIEEPFWDTNEGLWYPVKLENLQPNSYTPNGLLENRIFIDFICDVCDVEGGIRVDEKSLIGKWRFNETITAHTTFGAYGRSTRTNWFATGDQSTLHSYSSMKLEGNVLKYDYDDKVAYDGSVWRNNQYGEKESFRTISILEDPTSFTQNLGIKDLFTFHDWMRTSAEKISDDPGSPYQLPKPTIKLSDSVISWGAIKWVGSYEVYYTKTTGDGTQQLLTTTTNTSIDILEHLDTPGTYIFFIIAKPCYDTSVHDFAESECSNAIEYKVQPRLDTPTTTLIDGVLSWSAITNADHYEVYSGNNLLCNTTETSCNLKQYLFRNAYNYQVMVKACPSDDSYRSSEFSVALTFRQDTIVTNNMLIGEWKFNSTLVFEDNFQLTNENDYEGLSWFYATNYDNRYVLLRYSNNKLYYSKTYDSTGWETAYEDGWKQTKHQSIGIYRIPNTMSLFDYSIETFYNWISNNATKTSDTATVPIKLATPTLTMTGTALIWSAITNATQYEVNAHIYDDNNNLVGGTTWYVAGTNCDVYEHIDRNETFHIRVRAVGDCDYTYADSEWSNTITYTTEIEDDRKWLDAPIIALNGRYVVWNPVNNADYYTMYFDGGSSFILIDKNQSVYELFREGVARPKTSVTLVACAGEGSEWLNSTHSNTVVYDPDAKNEEVVVPDNDADAIHITVRYVNGVLLATADKYCDKNIQVHLDYVSLVNLIPGNIRAGVTILGVTGSLTPTIYKKE